MTKLMQWLMGLGLFLGTWAAVVTDKIQSPITSRNYNFILLSPVYLVALFGVYSILTIAYRVYNFNDCKEAAEELQKEINDAKEDLKKKGLKFD